MLEFIKIIVILFIMVLLSYLFRYYIEKNLIQNSYESITQNELPSYNTLAQDHETPPKYDET